MRAGLKILLREAKAVGGRVRTRAIPRIPTVVMERSDPKEPHAGIPRGANQ